MTQFQIPSGYWAAALALLTLAAGTPSEARAQAAPKPPGMSADGILKFFTTGQDGRQTAKWLEDAFEGQPLTEAAEMLVAIARGSQMGPGEGWFHPGQGRYGWDWLAARHGVKPDESLPRDKFVGPETTFARLDRNRDGELRADDFDWSDRGAYAQQSMMAGYWFRRVNKAGDGRLTREEWLKFFDEAAQGKD